MSSSFWMLRVESRDFSLAEKERTACKAEKIHKMVLGYQFEWKMLTFWEFAHLRKQCFLSQLEKNHGTQLPTAKNKRTCRAPYIFAILVHIQADDCLFYNGRLAKKQVWSFLTCLALLKVRFDELNHYDLKSIKILMFVQWKLEKYFCWQVKTNLEVSVDPSLWQWNP